MFLLSLYNEAQISHLLWDIVTSREPNVPLGFVHSKDQNVRLLPWTLSSNVLLTSIQWQTLIVLPHFELCCSSMFEACLGHWPYNVPLTFIHWTLHCPTETGTLTLQYISHFYTFALFIVPQNLVYWPYNVNLTFIHSHSSLFIRIWYIEPLCNVPVYLDQWELLNHNLNTFNVHTLTGTIIWRSDSVIGRRNVLNVLKRRGTMKAAWMAMYMLWMFQRSR